MGIAAVAVTTARSAAPKILQTVIDTAFSLHLRLQVIFDPNPVDQVQLGFQPVYMFFL